MAVQMSLWGEEFNIDDSALVNQVITKIKNKKQVAPASSEKLINSKRISLDEKMEIIKEDVYRILGHYTDDTLVIKTRDELHNYITEAIKNGVIDVDTETNNSIDPFTCKIMGLCLYTPGQKNAYVPINHVNRETNELLKNQCTEKDLYEELSRVLNIKCIFHNGKFDYLVIYCTCGVKLPICWDTMIGAQLLNENEPAGLKFQYKDKINHDQDKYDIEKLFQGLPYEIFDPELFALYAATDSYMTHQLYEYQLNEFTKPGNERLYNLFKNIEMPVVTVTAEMELRGVAVDKEFAKRLSVKFHKRLDGLDKVIAEEMSKYSDIIRIWRETPEANYHEMNYKTGKEKKSLSEQLFDPVELTSPTQLGILLYDVLKVLKLKSGETKKATDEETLLTIKDTLPLAGLILKKRELEKYLGTYIDVLPTYCNPRDDRVHAHFNQMGREDRNVVTGRMSSSDPSLQVIPARGEIVTVRCMFVATTEYPEIENKDNCYEIPIENEVLLEDGSYQWSSYLKPGDKLETGEEVKDIKIDDNMVYIFI